MPWKPNKVLLGLVGLFVVITLLWSTPVLLPLKILVVFFHEISHGFAAILTGGSIEKLTFEPNQGGLAFTRGGWSFVVVNAGYLGSFLWGSALILASSYTRRDRAITGALGFALAVITVLYVRNLFGFFFGLAAAAGFLAVARWLGDVVNDFLLKTVGLTSCGYAILDIWSDIFARSCRSDATMLADMTGIPRLFWGVLWIGLSVAGMYHTLRLAARSEERA